MSAGVLLETVALVFGIAVITGSIKLIDQEVQS